MKFKFIQKSFAFIFLLLIAIFYGIPLEAYLILKKFLKCGFCKKNIKFTSDTLVINSECKCSVSIPIVDIKAIYYGIKKDKYYFMIIKKNQLFCEVCNEENILKFIILKKHTKDIREISDLAKKYNLLVLPSLESCEPFIYLNTCNSVISYCFFEKNYLLVFEKNKDNITCRSQITNDSSFRQFDINDFNINIYKALNEQSTYLKQESSYYKKSKGIRIYLLDKKLTLDRGYGLFIYFDGNFLEDNIVYTFDKEEIKTKIIELFEKHNK